MKKNFAVKLKSVSQDMSESEFRLFRDFIYGKCGVNLNESKKMMLSSRLKKRLRALGMTSFRKYYEYVTSPHGRSEELVHMINVVTTNKTDFFRESKHYDFMVNQMLPAIYDAREGACPKRLNVWSAGCSSGEEPYTLAIVLSEFFSKKLAGDFTILATDISTRVLETGKRGIYPESTVAPIPHPLIRKYLMRGIGARKGYYRIVPELRARVKFQQLNLNDGSRFELKTMMDVIFCRNVIIYFDRQTQVKLFDKFYSQLRPGGYLFIGHSETLHGINDRFVPVTVAVYRKPG